MVLASGEGKARTQKEGSGDRENDRNVSPSNQIFAVSSDEKEPAAGGSERRSSFSV
jgi:hypothetical protein